MHGTGNLLSYLNNHLGLCWLFWGIFSFWKTFTSVWHWQRKRFISPEPKIRSLPSPPPLLLPVLLLYSRNLFTGKQRLLCCGSIRHISLPLIAFKDWNHAHYPVYVPPLMYVWERRSVSLLCWSPHCAGVTELKSERHKKKRGENNDARETQQWIPSPPTLLGTAAVHFCHVLVQSHMQMHKSFILDSVLTKEPTQTILLPWKYIRKTERNF